MLTDFIFYGLVIAGVAAFIGGVVHDLTVGNRNLKREAEREARRMNRTQKFTR